MAPKNRNVILATLLDLASFFYSALDSRASLSIMTSVHAYD